MATEISKIISTLFKRLELIRDWKYNEEQAAFLAEKMPILDEVQLRKAADKLAEEHKFKPNVAEILAACHFFKPATSASSRKFPWYEREKSIAWDVMQYLENYKDSDDMQKAREEGYERHLWNFARHTATSMAQMIHSKNGWGYNLMCVPEAFREAYSARMKSLATTPLENGINVRRANLPGLTEAWKNTPYVG